MIAKNPALLTCFFFPGEYSAKLSAKKIKKRHPLDLQQLTRKLELGSHFWEGLTTIGEGVITFFPGFLGEGARVRSATKRQIFLKVSAIPFFGHLFRKKKKVGYGCECRQCPPQEQGPGNRAFVGKRQAPPLQADTLFGGGGLAQCECGRPPMAARHAMGCVMVSIPITSRMPSSVACRQGRTSKRGADCPQALGNKIRMGLCHLCGREGGNHNAPIYNAAETQKQQFGHMKLEISGLFKFRLDFVGLT